MNEDPFEEDFGSSENPIPFELWEELFEDDPEALQKLLSKRSLTPIGFEVYQNIRKLAGDFPTDDDIVQAVKRVMIPFLRESLRVDLTESERQAEEERQISRWVDLFRQHRAMMAKIRGFAAD